ncbi:MAG: glycosyltransferase family 9 protein [Bacteroidetes bacterium]|nr:glycosyltransferase family 9 protein [Bacteroidota bacterium]
MKILVIRFSAIGDVLLTFPVLQGLNDKFPTAEIFFLTKHEQLPLLQLLPFEVKGLELQKSISDTAKVLKHHRFDQIIDLHNNLRTLLLQWSMFRFQWSRVKKHNAAKWCMTRFKTKNTWVPSIVERYAKAAKVELMGKRMVLNLDHAAPLSLPTKYAVWVLGAKFKTKQFPLEKIRQTLALCDVPIILLGGEEELTMASSLSQEFPRLINLVGKADFFQAALLLSRAKLVVTNDTGMMHLTSFYNLPMLCLWGNTVPGFGMGPYGCDKVEHFQVTDLSCRPCSKIGYQECPKGHFKCMMQQDSTLLAARISAIFHQESPK